ncbi:hypothetical protein Ddye_014364 [Dipteronia dyeriana]|uniref:Uncharacterized protein n=1 Tax=Dipteronia dyeriana TaxID=168575 RepID=A0AAE0CL36_9ROSI|nr:hypothetical protein Ddye_014364 [Dipteronia dyeriana]
MVGSFNLSDQPPAVDDTDLSLKKFDEYQAHLQELQMEEHLKFYMYVVDHN